MRTIVLNNHSKYHSGCRAVIDVLHNDLNVNGYTVISSTDRDCDSELFNSAELVIINGEGTMHNKLGNRLEPQSLLELLCVAKESGKKTALINSVWQHMNISDRAIDVLKNSYISVRECLSAEHMTETIGITPDIHLDLSYYAPIKSETQPHTELLCGKSFPPQQDYRPPNCASVDIFSEQWHTLINKIKHSDWFFTGRHHELYASCVAGTPVSVMSSNTWKNEGLFATAGVDIPVAEGNISHADIPDFISMCKERRGEYDKLFTWMKAQTPWSSSLLEKL